MQVMNGMVIDEAGALMSLILGLGNEFNVPAPKSNSLQDLSLTINALLEKIGNPVLTEFSASVGKSMLENYKADLDVLMSANLSTNKTSFH